MLLNEQLCKIIIAIKELLGELLLEHTIALQSILRLLLSGHGPRRFPLELNHLGKVSGSQCRIICLVRVFCFLFTLNHHDYNKYNIDCYEASRNVKVYFFHKEHYEKEV